VGPPLSSYVSSLLLSTAYMFTLDISLMGFERMVGCWEIVVLPIGNSAVCQGEQCTTTKSGITSTHPPPSGDHGDGL
jgi:hypothetical protein